MCLRFEGRKVCGFIGGVEGRTEILMSCPGVYTTFPVDSTFAKSNSVTGVSSFSNNNVLKEYYYFSWLFSFVIEVILDLNLTNVPGQGVFYKIEQLPFL